MNGTGHGEWEDANVRVGNYLRAMRVANEERQAEIVSSILERAANRAKERPAFRPAILVVEEIRAATARWLAQVLPSSEHVAVGDFLSLRVINALENWPTAFLAEEVPAELQRAMLRSKVRAVPELQISSMVPEPFDNPLLGTLPLRNALAMLARSLQRAKKSSTATMPAKSPPPAGWSP
jgi:hypothetical protein